MAMLQLYMGDADGLQRFGQTRVDRLYGDYGHAQPVVLGDQHYASSQYICESRSTVHDSVHSHGVKRHPLKPISKPEICRSFKSRSIGNRATTD